MADARASERFIRVVGKRLRPPEGEVPTAEARAALAQMANYRTCAPKGVFVYASHEAANRARDEWTVQGVVNRSK
jgi:hypothetical protein